MPTVEAAARRAQTETTISYRIDRSDTIVWVNETWNTFAQSNGWNEADSVLGRPVWEFVAGRETQLIWRELLARARTGVAIQVPFRCDAPAVRRYLQLAIKPAKSGEVFFASTTDRLIERNPLALLSAHYAEGEPIRCCSWCKRFDAEGWVEVEEAVERLGLLEQDIRPVTHAMCADCEASLRSLAGL